MANRSSQAVIRACRKDADAILIVLADQPLVTAIHLSKLIDTCSGANAQTSGIDGQN